MATSLPSRMLHTVSGWSNCGNVATRSSIFESAGRKKRDQVHLRRPNGGHGGGREGHGCKHTGGAEEYHRVVRIDSREQSR